MAVNQYILFVCLYSCLCCVSCDLNLNEGEPCVTDGVNGTCVGIFRCTSVSLMYLYANAGFDLKKYGFSELPDFCSYKNNEPVVCCTDCEITQVEKYRRYLVGTFGHLRELHGPLALNKCHENFARLPYPCRGQGTINFRRTWKEDRKCHGYYLVPQRAVGGRNAERSEFPHAALIGYGGDVESAQWLCGGSVISERFILTAGHCSGTVALGNITFAALGLLKRSDPEKYWKIHKIKRIIVHPEYKPPSKYHDIALLETETEINFDKDILPACLDVGDRSKLKIAAFGWGRLGSHEQPLADTLQVVYLEEYYEEECAAIYQPHRLLKNGYDHEKQMCYGKNDKIADTCEGDSGGSLQIDDFGCLYTIAGVTSYGKECGKEVGLAGMYTRVSYYVPWIENIVWPEEVEALKKKEEEWLVKWLNEP